MASRKEQKEALRQERLKREQEAAQAAARKRLVGIVVAAVLGLAIIGVLVVVLVAGGGDSGDSSSGGDSSVKVDYPDGGKIPDQQETDLDKAAAAANCKLELHKLPGAGQHTSDPVNYKTEPPTIGPHFPVPAEDKMYDTEQPAEHVVHALEHGRIVVWFRPDASQELLGQLKALYDEDPYHMLMTPRKELKEAVDVSAWQAPDRGRILRCPEASDKMWDAIRAFKDKYRDKGPEFIP